MFDIKSVKPFHLIDQSLAAQINELQLNESDINSLAQRVSDIRGGGDIEIDPNFLTGSDGVRFASIHYYLDRASTAIQQLKSAVSTYRTLINERKSIIQSISDYEDQKKHLNDALNVDKITRERAEFVEELRCIDGVISSLSGLKDLNEVQLASEFSSEAILKKSKKEREATYITFTMQNQNVTNNAPIGFFETILSDAPAGTATTRPIVLSEFASQTSRQSQQLVADDLRKVIESLQSQILSYKATLSSAKQRLNSFEESIKDKTFQLISVSQRLLAAKAKLDGDDDNFLERLEGIAQEYEQFRQMFTKNFFKAIYIFNEVFHVNTPSPNDVVELSTKILKNDRIISRLSIFLNNMIFAADRVLTTSVEQLLYRDINVNIASQQSFDLNFQIQQSGQDFLFFGIGAVISLPIASKDAAEILEIRVNQNIANFDSTDFGPFSSSGIKLQIFSNRDDFFNDTTNRDAIRQWIYLKNNTLNLTITNKTDAAFTDNIKICLVASTVR